MYIKNISVQIFDQIKSYQEQLELGKIHLVRFWSQLPSLSFPQLVAFLLCQGFKGVPLDGQFLGLWAVTSNNGKVFFVCLDYNGTVFRGSVLGPMKKKTFFSCFSFLSLCKTAKAKPHTWSPNVFCVFLAITKR